MTKNNLCKLYNTNEAIIDIIIEAEEKLATLFIELEQIKEANFLKVISAMQNSSLNYTHFYWNTGYGYNDPGREKVEDIFADIFNTEDALVRPNIVSGTHAIYLTLSGLLNYGDNVISISGKPYDTLLTVLGVSGNESNNLKEQGIMFKEVNLKNNDFDIKEINKSIDSNTKAIMIQRSKGYSDRKALSIEKIKIICSYLKANYPDIYILVDNCYGEFVDYYEPTDAGADIVMGSLIKNPGGSIALSGGYVCGPSLLIKKIANRLTAPGIGKEVGLTFGHTRNILQGLYLGPIVTIEAIKGALLFAQIYESIGYKVIPGPLEQRNDIVQAIVFNSEEKLLKFCQSIQNASPVDSNATLYPSNMPGYENKIVMAAGTFVQGASIELSADAPIRPPYIAYLQGGVSYYQCKYAAIKSLESIL